jgi:hypothetical protein
MEIAVNGQQSGTVDGASVMKASSWMAARSAVMFAKTDRLIWTVSVVGLKFARATSRYRPASRSW